MVDEKEISIIIRKNALANAIKFKGRANPKAILGSIIKEKPEIKSELKSIASLINKIVDEINSLSFDEQKKELLRIQPDYFEKQRELKNKKKEERQNLPPLPNAEIEKVTTRMPPEPSKYPHLGHAMSFLINYLYAKKYEGKVVLRFDDTNPEKESEEYVSAIKEDIIGFLGAEPDDIVFASDHMNKFYELAEDLIKRGKAYACTCSQEVIKSNRRNMVECLHRENDINTNLKLWSDMKSGTEGIVLRLKIDMAHKNAVMRDPVIFRVSNVPHYKTGLKFKAWPMYDFESTIEEELCGVTHVLRGNEFDQRIELQDYIGSLFNFKKVYYKHYGRFSIQGAITQGREIRRLIEEGKYIGWDDPRLVTIRALKRRGITREAFYELAKKIGMSKTQTNLDFSVIAAINRSILDKKAKRFFAIRNPVLITINNIPSDINELRLGFHPDSKKEDRILMVSNEFFIEKDDFDRISDGSLVRLMDAFNIRKVSGNNFEFASSSYDDFKVVKNKSLIIHYLPKPAALKGVVVMPDASEISVLVENNINSLSEGDIIQFERWGFCRLDNKNKNVFWFAHS